MGGSQLVHLDPKVLVGYEQNIVFAMYHNTVVTRASYRK